jgi:5,6-dimethylbenzimidazole synthase
MSPRDVGRLRLLGPAHVVVVAYLCLGYAQEFFHEPELQRRRWASRVPLDQLVYRERWGQSAS